MNREEAHFEYADHDEQNDWSPNDEIEKEEPDEPDFPSCSRKMNYNEEYPY